MINSISNNCLDRACQIGAVVTISLIVAGIVALFITQSGVFHPYFSPMIGMGLLFSALPTYFITHILGNVLRAQELPLNLSFGLSSSDSEEFTPQILGFSAEANGQGPFAKRKTPRDASKVPESEGEKPKTQVLRQYP